jgi:transcriptional/translational regulatory protein YebC/TACO1
MIPRSQFIAIQPILRRFDRHWRQKKYNIVRAESTLLPKTKIEVGDEKVAHQIMRLVEKLEDLDDVQNVYTNADFPEEFAASYA